MKRRIDAAKQMLSGTGAALVDVALDVGFKSQAHFTTVFKRFTGAPPTGGGPSSRIRCPATEDRRPCPAASADAFISRTE
jgi:AraC-like DNA-binding protein